MNTLFQWLHRNSSVVAIIISLISMTLSIIGLVRPSTNVQRQEKMRRLKKIWSSRYAIFHFVAFVCLTIYVLANWGKCISMQFLTQFDGNNILFIVWIILSFLIIYEVEGKGVKIARHKQEEDQQNLNTTQLKYKIDAMQKQINSSNPNLDKTYQNEDGGQ